MPLSVPNNPPVVNEAVAKPVSVGAVISVTENETKINQLHGIAGNNTLGAGIPKQVTNVQVSVANAQTGSTCTVSILFKQDPTDNNFSGVNIWVKGYQGNAQLVQVASGTASPCKFVLNNTGEIVSFTVQAFGNGGNAPLTQAPSCSGTLPKSTAGGYGSSTVVVSSTQGIAVAGSVAADDDVLQYSASLGKYENIRRFIYDWSWDARNGATVPTFSVIGPFLSTSSGTSSLGTISQVDNSTYPSSQKFLTSSLAGNSAGLFYTVPSKPPLNCFGRTRFRVQLNQTTNTRMWIGIANIANLTGTLQADTPANNLIGFRYSTHAGDTKWQLVVGTSALAMTVQAESGAHLDTNPHTFDIVYSSSLVSFYIDGAFVGSITTNIPASTVLVTPFVAIDNVGVAVADSFNFFFIRGCYPQALQ